MARPKQTEIIEHEGNDEAYGELTPATQRGQIVSERNLFGDVTTAQPVKVHRNEPRILQKIDAMANAAGEQWFYRFPVKKKGGGVDYIEGPSIECTDAVARYYGNCRVDCAVEEYPNYWVFHGRFSDWESGYCVVRPFRQGKFTARLGGDDEERKLAMAYATGVSKAERNVVDHALKDFTTRAFEAAKKNLVERIGKSLPHYRERCTERILALGSPELLKRVEQVYGRKVADWLAPDVARVIAELRAINDGMASVDDTWPAAPPPEPRRSDVPDAAAAPSDAPGEPPAAEPSGDAPQERAPDAPAMAEAEPAAAKVWKLVGEFVGQDAVITALQNLAGMATTPNDVDEIERQNEDRLAKITGHKRAVLNNFLRARKEELAGPA